MEWWRILVVRSRLIGGEACLDLLLMAFYGEQDSITAWGRVLHGNGTGREDMIPHEVEEEVEDA